LSRGVTMGVQNASAPPFSLLDEILVKLW
jgi:hypothetical protein